MQDKFMLKHNKKLTTITDCASDKPGNLKYMDTCSSQNNQTIKIQKTKNFSEGYI